MSFRTVFIFALAAATVSFAAPVAKHEGKPAWTGAPLDAVHQEAAYGFRNEVNTWHDAIPKLDAQGQEKVFKKIYDFSKDVAKLEKQVYVQKNGMDAFDQLYREGEDQWIYNIPTDDLKAKKVQKAFEKVDKEIKDQMEHHAVAGAA